MINKNIYKCRNKYTCFGHLHNLCTTQCKGNLTMEKSLDQACGVYLAAEFDQGQIEFRFHWNEIETLLESPPPSGTVLFVHTTL